MADDGLLLNLELGSEPLRPRVKFKGGRWRDRKRAENAARRLTSARSAPAPASDHDEQRLSKRRRVEGNHMPANSNPESSSSPQGSDKLVTKPIGKHLPDPAAQRQKRPLDSARPSRQVISSLFSYNPTPSQTPNASQDQEWTAPQPSNAPLADVANFGSLTLSSRLVNELAKMKLERPTAIQKTVIPYLLSSSSDAFVQAETGSGKTFSYLLPIIHRVLLLSSQSDGRKIHRNSGVFAIIVSPTRELAKQVYLVLKRLLRPFPWLVPTAITGGESKKAEKARIRKGVNFLVATPGRLADHVDNTEALELGCVRWLILDEGDRLMELGFQEDLRKVITVLRQAPIVGKSSNGTSLDPLPDRRVTVLCSATLHMRVQELGEMSLVDASLLTAQKSDDDPVIQDAVHKAPAQLHQSFVVVPSKLRLVTLVSYLRSVFSRRGCAMKVIVFMSCANSVDFHFQLLKQPDDSDKMDSATTDDDLDPKTVAKAAYVTSAASPEVVLHRLHGSLSQQARKATLRSFSTCKQPSVLVTTDVSSRGLDIPSVGLVVEYDPAFSFADHIHRVGRTARAGRAGDAMLFLLPGPEEGYVELLKSSTPPTSQPYETILRKGLMGELVFPIETSATSTNEQSPHEKAETLQLHWEQRLLGDGKLLDSARDGFKSHIRAYATHIKDERAHFDITQLHLGHVAKSFGLRETPGGIGAGLDRKAMKNKESRKGRVRPKKSAKDVIEEKSQNLMMNMADEFNIG